MMVAAMRKGQNAYLAWMLLVLLTAVSLRLFSLATIPPGLTHDEADHGITAWSIVNGARALYFTIGYGREPLYDYATAVLMRFLGPTYLAGRLTAVYFSLILIAGMAAWVRRAFGWQTAVLAAAGLAVSFWPVMTARQSLRSITLPALFVLVVYLFWRGLEENGMRINADEHGSKSASTRAHQRPYPLFCRRRRPPRPDVLHVHSGAFAVGDFSGNAGVSGLAKSAAAAASLAGHGRHAAVGRAGGCAIVRLFAGSPGGGDAHWATQRAADGRYPGQRHPALAKHAGRAGYPLLARRRILALQRQWDAFTATVDGRFVCWRAGRSLVVAGDR
jgi:hypothetical protein